MSLADNNACWDILDLAVLWTHLKPRLIARFGSSSNEMQQVLRMWSAGCLLASFRL